MAHLLLLSSANNSPASNYVEPVAGLPTGALFSKKKLQFQNQNCEVYEDIHLNSMKTNVYCYIPTSTVVGEASSTSSSSRGSTLEDAQPSTSSQSGSPVFKHIETTHTSTPCLPKTLPPTMSQHEDKDEYDVPDSSGTKSSHEYTTYLVNEKTKTGSVVAEEQTYDDDYQVPINLPKDLKKD